MLKEQGVISSWTIQGLVGIKVKFQASSTSWFHPVWGLCSCGKKFSSGGGLLPVKATYECVSGIYLYLPGNWEFGNSVM